MNSLPPLIFYTPGATPQRTLLREFKERTKENFCTQPLWYDAVPFQISSRVGILGPAIGAPIAALLLERLEKSQVKKLVLFGCAGDVHGLEIGDLLMPTCVIPEDGTSRLLGNTSEFPCLSNPLQTELKRLIDYQRSMQGEAERPAFVEGKVWTTDAPLTESIEKVEVYANAGAFAVEMELAPLVHLSQMKGIQLCACLVISDLLERKDRPSQKGYQSAKFKRSLQLAARALAELAASE